jgi:5-formyltetrahydrofolate cyclo-ligase
MDKSTIRLQAKVLRDAQPQKMATERAREVVRRMLDLPELHQSAVQNRFISLYHPIRSELDILGAVAELARRGARILLPVILPEPDGVSALAMGEVPSEIALKCDMDPQTLTDWLDPGSFGLREPSRGALVPIEALRHEFACVIIPGLAYDLHGTRVGYGKGYYDGFLARFRGAGQPHLPVIAPAFDFQLLDEAIPIAPHDVPVDIVVTPTRTLATNRFTSR